MELTELLERAAAVERDLDRIRTRVTGAIMFVDLVGSTAYKSDHPAEDDWLPRLATFLLAVTAIVQKDGRVVKYIGDEVMAMFEGPAAVMNAEHATEQVLQFCEGYKDQDFAVKIALDVGSVSLLDFAADPKAQFGRRDPNGLVVDRCARIMAKTPGGTVVCSDDFRTASPLGKARWRPAGRFQAKGISRRVKIYQLKYKGYEAVTISDPPMSLDECTKRLAAAEEHNRELRAMRRATPRRPRV